MSSDTPTAGEIAKSLWANGYVETLEELIRIPAVSPSFDPAWDENGGLDAVVEFAATWLSSREEAPTVHVSRIPGRTPLLLAQTAGDPDAGHVLMYGHLDKQPPGSGWTVTPDAWTPLRVGDRLFGRGSADDAYSVLAGWGAYQAARTAARAAKTPVPACTLLLEASEESSSVDLPAHLDALAELIGAPDVVVCLDAFTPDHERVWSTSSLRGIVVMDLTVSTLSQSTHSGDAGNIAPSPFRILRLLLDRIEDAATGTVLLPGLFTTPPAHLPGIVDGMIAGGLGSPVEALPFLPGVSPEHAELRDQFLQRAWSPAIAYAGLDGFPSTQAAASVILPGISLRLSIRIPPDLDPAAAAATLTSALTAEPPFGATVAVDLVAAQAGFAAPALSPALASSLSAASERYYGGSTGFFAAGVTIPFMGMLGQRFPTAQVLTLGALDPHSNPHSADESLDLIAAAKLTAVLADVLVDLPATLAS